MVSLTVTSYSEAKLPNPSANMTPKPEVIDFFFRPPPKPDDLEGAIAQHIQQYKLYYHPDDFNEDEVRELHTKAYQRAYHPDGNKRQLLAMIFATPRGEQLKLIKLPSLIIHGDIDPVVSTEHGKQLAKCLTNSQLEIVENMGHGIPSRYTSPIVELINKHIKKIDA